MSRRADQLRRAAPAYDPAEPPAGVKLWLGVVASELNVTITEMSVAAGISRSAIANVLSNVWPVKTPQEQIRTALTELLASRGATDEDLARLFHAHGRANGTAGAARQRGPEARPHQPGPTEATEEEPDMLPMKTALTPQARRHFKLFSNPFGDVTSAEAMFSGAEFEYVREAVWQAAQVSGFVAVVGESGAGKTTVMEDLETRLQHSTQRVVIFRPSVLGMEENDTKGKTLKSADVLHAIISELAPDQPMPQTIPARTLRARKLLAGSASMGNLHLLVIEEAHCMPNATMKHLKRLHELREGRRNLLGILLLAQPELKTRLTSGMVDGSLREVAQRCEIVELMPLDSDIKPYLVKRATAANVDIGRLISDKAIEQLRERLTVKRGAQKVSLAYPLAVNNMLIRALNAAAEIGAPCVDEEIAKSC